jgi:hypothetical protein
MAAQPCSYSFLGDLCHCTITFAQLLCDVLPGKLAGTLVEHLGGLLGCYIPCHVNCWWRLSARMARPPQDCNLVMYDSGGANQANAIYYSATYGGAGPCALTVSGLGGGFIAVEDSAFRVLYAQPPAFGVRAALKP